jgi:hypothetical protein
MPYNEYSNSKCCYRKYPLQPNELVKLPSLYKSRVSLLFDSKLNHKPSSKMDACPIQKSKAREYSEVERKDGPILLETVGNQSNCVAHDKHTTKHNMRPSTSNEVCRPDSRYNQKCLFKKLEVKNERENEYYIPIVKWGNEDNGLHEYIPEFWSAMKKG